MVDNYPASVSVARDPEEQSLLHSGSAHKTKKRKADAGNGEDGLRVSGRWGGGHPAHLKADRRGDRGVRPALSTEKERSGVGSQAERKDPRGQGRYRVLSQVEE